MKALCIRQPFASMLAALAPITETRMWSTKYRGPILIVASKTGAPPGMPTGQAVAICELTECRHVTAQDAKTAYCVSSPEAYAWIFTNMRPVIPFNVRGRQGLFDVELPAGVERP